MVRAVQIGGVRLATNLLLAPMSGYCDLAFRLVARSCGGVGLGVTDLLCPEGLLRAGRHSLSLASTCAADRPLAMQLYGSEPKLLADAARWAEDHGADIVDINMGCPADKITGRDAGSRLLCDPERTVRVVEQVVRALRRVPLTAKLRLGWNDGSIVAPELARRLEETGVAAITIHGRTTEMGFSGRCRLDGIAAVVAAVSRIPVIGNGDIRSPQDAERMMRQTRCAGVMIGRYALSAPWIFRDTWGYLTTGTIPPPPTLEEKVQLMRDHFANMRRLRNDRAAVLEFRHRVSWYARQMHPCEVLRRDMRLIASPADFDRVVDAFLAWRRQRDEPRADPVVPTSGWPA